MCLQLLATVRPKDWSITLPSITERGCLRTVEESHDPTNGGEPGMLSDATVGTPDGTSQDQQQRKFRDVKAARIYF